MTKHAVVTDTQFYWISDEERRLVRMLMPEPIMHASDLWLAGQDLGITHFWVMPGCEIATMGWDFYTEKAGFKAFVPGVRDENVPPHAVTYGKGKGSREIHINYPASGAGFGWIVERPLDVLAAVDYLAGLLLTMDIKYSPQHLGKNHLKALYRGTKRLQSYIAPCEDDLTRFPFRQAAKEIYFCTPLSAANVGKWFHLYDKNSAHPAAARSMVTGIGHMEHVTDVSLIDFKKPGIFKISFIPRGIFDGEILPMIIEQDQEWVTLDVLKYARNMGYHVVIHEAYVFEKGLNIWGEWVKDLWDVRQELKNEQKFLHETARLNAYDTAKSIMNTTISATKSNINWWSDMVGFARTARLANLRTFLANAQMYPLYVYADDMAFVSDYADPNLAVPMILDRKDKLGGYKCKYSFQLTSEMILRCEGFMKMPAMGASQRIHNYFKAQARERGLIDE
jgi:hypothetical protein